MTLIYWKAGLQAPKQKSDEKKEWADSTVLIPHLQWRYKKLKFPSGLVNSKAFWLEWQRKSMLSTSAIVKRKVLFERVASIFETWFVIRFWGGELTVLSFAYSLSFLLFFSFAATSSTISLQNCRETEKAASWTGSSSFVSHSQSPGYTLPQTGQG